MQICSNTYSSNQFSRKSSRLSADLGNKYEQIDGLYPQVQFTQDGAKIVGIGWMAPTYKIVVLDLASREKKYYADFFEPIETLYVGKNSKAFAIDKNGYEAVLDIGTGDVTTFHDHIRRVGSSKMDQSGRFVITRGFDDYALVLRDLVSGIKTVISPAHDPEGPERWFGRIYGFSPDGSQVLMQQYRWNPKERETKVDVVLINLKTLHSKVFSGRSYECTTDAGFYTGDDIYFAYVNTKGDVPAKEEMLATYNIPNEKLDVIVQPRVGDREFFNNFDFYLEHIYTEKAGEEVEIYLKN